MDFVIWGAGTWGKYVYNCLKAFNYNIRAYIDINPERVGTRFLEIPDISYEMYLSLHRDCIVIIALLEKEDRNHVKFMLRKEGVNCYIDCQECPIDIFMPYNRVGEEAFPMEEAINKVLQGNIQSKRIGIFGLNIFAFAVYDFLNDKGGLPTIIVEEHDYRHEDPIWEKIGDRYRIVSQKTMLGEFEYILDVKPTGNKRKKFSAEEHVIPFYDFPYLNDYKNEELENFRSIYRNERCFLVANGPSLKVADLDTLFRNKEISFGVNFIYKIFPFVSWRPQYYFASEPDVINNEEDELENMDVDHIFLGDLSLSFFRRKINGKISRYHIKWEYDYDNVFSDDITKGVFGGATTVYHALQVAVYMGFKKIYIIGADCEYKNGDGFDKGSHFIPNYADKGKASKKSVLHTNIIFSAYSSARRYAEENGIEIYNATRGGKLEVFKRVDFDSLFTD